MDNSFSFKNIIFILKHLMKASKLRIFIDILYAILCAFEVLILQILFVQGIIQLVIDNHTINDIFRLILFSAIFKIIKIIYDTLRENIIHPLTKEKIDLYFATLIQNKLVKTDPDYYDDNNYYDEIIYANNKANEKCIELLDSIVTLIQTVLTILFTLGYVLFVDYILLFLTIIPIAIDAYLRTKMNNLSHYQEVEIESAKREAQYALNVLTTEKYAKEIRTSNISSAIKSKFDLAYNRLCNAYLKYEKKFLSLYLASDLIFEPKNIIVIIYIAYNVIVTKKIQASEFLAVQAALLSLASTLKKINTHVLVFYRHSLFAGNLKKFLQSISNLSNGIKIVDSINNIELKNVSFTYKKSNKKIIDQINLKINKGEKVAIVGVNGAGKTTLIKLLYHFYEPDNGEICINGVPLSQYDRNSYMSSLSSVAQNFNMYMISIYENIVASSNKKMTEKQIDDILEMVGLLKFVKQLPHGINTVFGKSISDSGCELSKGQMQSFSLARAYAKNGQLLIMDEPSSSLDAFSELKIIEAIKKFAREKTVIMVSHKLLLTKDFDKIIVLDKGKIVEMGNHNELMSFKGMYYNLFNAQQFSKF